MFFLSTEYILSLIWERGLQHKTWGNAGHLFAWNSGNKDKRLLTLLISFYGYWIAVNITLSASGLSCVEQISFAIISVKYRRFSPYRSIYILSNICYLSYVLHNIYFNQVCVCVTRERFIFIYMFIISHVPHSLLLCYFNQDSGFGDTKFSLIRSKRYFHSMKNSKLTGFHFLVLKGCSTL